MNSWSSQRKAIYGSTLAIAIVLISMYLLRNVLFPTPTCFDAKENGFETGVDCGGTCSLRCTQDVIPLSVVWSRTIKTSATTYDFVALVSNKNIDNAPQHIDYTFTAYDVNGTKLTEATSSTVVPIDGDFPIIIQNVSLTEMPRDLQATINAKVPHYKVLEKPTVPTLRITGTRYEAGSVPRVYAFITNQKRIVLRDVPVRVFLYDADGNVFGAGETIIPILDKEATRQVVFTWNGAFPNAPTKIRVFPILDPFLGSL